MSRAHDTPPGPSPDDKNSTKGHKIRIDFGGGRPPTFTAGGSKRYLIQEGRYSRSAGVVIGQVMVYAIIRLADGTEVHGLVELDETSSGEHSGTGVFFINGAGQLDVAFQGEPGFLDALGRTSDQVFPYQYKPSGRCLAPSNHHLGADGWSR